MFIYILNTYKIGEFLISSGISLSKNKLDKVKTGLDNLNTAMKSK